MEHGFIQLSAFSPADRPLHASRPLSQLPVTWKKAETNLDTQGQPKVASKYHLNISHFKLNNEGSQCYVSKYGSIFN